VQEAWIRALVALPFGLAIGSFMTVVVARVPAKGSIVSPASRCPRCGTALRTRDNVPVLGWVLLRGRCRSCGERISVMYPVVELTTTALIVGSFWRYDDPWVAFALAGLLALMPAISAIDIAHRIIPNAIIYPSLVAFPVFLVIAQLAGAPVDLATMVIGFAAFGGGLFVVALISRGMGMGDVKLAALIGLVLGSLGLRYVGVAAGAAILLGGLGAVVALASGMGRKAAIPFGPYLAGGAVVAAFWGGSIASWYLDTLAA
jgi:leader peptidase (prepilin peptidase)/N-methyltransferase